MPPRRQLVPVWGQDHTDHHCCPGIRGEVPLVKAYTGMQADVLDWHLERGIDGLVVEGTGAGNVPSSVAPGIGRLLDADVPVIVTSRCPYGARDGLRRGAFGRSCRTLTRLGSLQGLPRRAC